MSQPLDFMERIKRAIEARNAMRKHRLAGQPIAKRGGYQPTANGPAPTKPPAESGPKTRRT